MWIDRVTDSRTVRAIELSAQFAEQRQRVLAENLANIDTPDYETQRLDPEVFQAALHTALQTADGPDSARLELRGGAQVASRPDGGLQLTPGRVPAENVLFHDGTNVRTERLLTDIAENALSYELATNLLRGRYETMLRAIRGRVS